MVNVLYEFRTYLHDPAAIFSGFTGSFFGAVIGGVLVGVGIRKRSRLPPGDWLIVIALYIPLGHILGRIGCLLSGCCYGVESSLPWALPCAAGDPRLRHPTQIYEMLANIVDLCCSYRLVTAGSGGEKAGILMGSFLAFTLVCIV